MNYHTPKNSVITTPNTNTHITLKKANFSTEVTPTEGIHYFIIIQILVQGKSWTYQQYQALEEEVVVTCQNMFYRRWILL